MSCFYNTSAAICAIVTWKTRFVNRKELTMSTQAKIPAQVTVKGTAKGVQHIQNWDEKPYKEFADGKKLTKATVTATFSGDIEGDGLVEYLMSYPDPNSASYVGLQLVN